MRIRQHRSRALPEDMSDANGANADHVSEPCSRSGVLASTGLTAKLRGDLANLPYACGSNRVTHGKQSARGVDRDAAADVELAGLELSGGRARGADAHGLEVEELLDGEGVVQLDNIELVHSHACLLERLRSRLAGQGSVEVLAVVDRLGS